MLHLLTLLLLLPVLGAMVSVVYSLIPGQREANLSWIAAVGARYH